MTYRKLTRRQFIWILGASGLAVSCGRAEGSAMPDIKELVADGIWTGTNNPRAIWAGGRLFVGHGSTSGIWVREFDAAGDQISAFHLWNPGTPDDHNVSSVGVRPDGRLVVAYSKHAGEEMRVRISDAPFSAASFGPEIFAATPLRDVITYPHLFYLSSEDRWYLMYRDLTQFETHGPPTLVTSDDGGLTWSAPQPLMNDNAERPYTNMSSNSLDRIDIILTDGHPAVSNPNHLYHMYYEAGTWRTTDGTDLGQPPFDHSSLVKVHNDTGASHSRGWDIVGGPNPVAVYLSRPAIGEETYNYARWDGTQWVSRKILETTGGYDTDSNIASGGLYLDHSDTSTVYVSRNVGTVFEIQKFSTTDHGLTWASEAITADSPEPVENFRPVTVDNGPIKILWCRGIYVDSFDYTVGIYTVDSSVSSGTTNLGELPFGATSSVVEWKSFDLVSGKLIAELPDASGEISRVLGEYTTTTINLPIPLSGDSALGDVALKATDPGRTLIVAVVNNQPAWGGLVIKRDAGTGATMDLSCVTLEGYLARRSVKDHEWVDQDVVSVIAAGIAADAGNIAGVGSGIGLEIDAQPTGDLRSMTTLASDHAWVYDKLQALMNQDGGPEWTIELVWADDTHNLIRKVLRIRKRIGIASSNPQAVFSVTPASVFDTKGDSNTRYLYSESYNDELGANYVVAYSSGEGDDQPESDPAIATEVLDSGFPIYERYFQPDSDIIDKDVLNDYASRDLELRQNGALVWEIESRWNVYPNLNIHWRMGDDIAWKVVGHRHPKGVSGVGRCIGWTMNTEAGTVVPVILDPSAGG